MQGKEIEKLTKIIAKLPALGTRSARRIVLQLLKKKETALLPLITALQEVADNVKKCPICGNFDTQELFAKIPPVIKKLSASCKMLPIYGQWKESDFIAVNIMF